MAAELGTLYRVQELDTRAAGLRERLIQLDDGSGLAAELAAAQADLAAAQTGLHEIEKTILDEELEMKGQEAKKREVEDKLYGGRIRNPKELADFEREAKMLSTTIGHHEDALLGLMDQAEAARRALAEQKERVADLEGRLGGTRERYQDNHARLDAELAEVNALRADAATAVEPALLRRYDEIRAHALGIGVVRVTGTVCAGCRVSLASDTLRLLKGTARVQFCESCGRMLYWAEGEATEQ
jgi:predicted  nucleic acid-binding Zn-ribbon protein